MNKAKLKTYAPQARRDFIAAVTARAHLLGLHEAGGRLEVAPAERQGDVALIAGQAWPVRVLGQRDKLVQRMSRDGFAQTLEAVAYTWFNRFAALRFMEIHDYLGHGQRVLSSREGGLPEILAASVDMARRGDLPTLDAAKVEEMKLAGNQDGELYRLLLVAQCNTLASSMPFLFERIDDETELLLPDNLLRTDSVIAGLVGAIAEEDWAEVEIIGWLYQFYISEKKDAVIGKVVKSEDIPAATQLFTPNWIVQYLVQNSVGRLWCMANPSSILKSRWPYYIEPAEQTPEVNAALAALAQARMDEDGGSLNPESITVLDPACGSGHILVEAYETLKAIYLERGYRLRDIPRLILEKNLYGLDIDDRAAQMAGFALLMKARADDRRLLDGPLKLNVLSLQESKGLDVAVLSQPLQTYLTVGRGSPRDVTRRAEFGSDDLFPNIRPQMSLGESAARSKPHPALVSLIEMFANAKTFGSLIQIPPDLSAALPVLAAALQQAAASGDLYAEKAAKDLLPLVEQARALAMQFDVVVANPPYMGGKGMNTALKDYAKLNFPDSKADVFSMFIERCQCFGKSSSELGFVTPYVWMFISSYEEVRLKLIAGSTIKSLIQLEYNAFEPACVPVCAFVIGNSNVGGYASSYIKLSDFKGHENQSPKTLEAIADRSCGWFYNAKSDDFKKIPGSPIAYWIGERLSSAFSVGSKINKISVVFEGVKSRDSDRFLRYWFELDFTSAKWKPYAKGGGYQKWFGNELYALRWDELLWGFKKASGVSFKYFFKPTVTYSTLSSSALSCRYTENSLFGGGGAGITNASSENLLLIQAFLTSSVGQKFLEITSPTLNFEVGTVGSLCVKEVSNISAARECVKISKDNWNYYEVSRDFKLLPFHGCNAVGGTVDGSLNSMLCLERCWELWCAKNTADVEKIIELEGTNNRVFIEAYGLKGVLSAEVSEDSITLVRADREKDCQRLISYAMGCMMGRYSLDEPGLIYAHAGNVGFDADRYKTFPADADGIVPITDELWFEDDAAHRVREFLLVVWGPETLAENMAWLAESLGVKGGETPDETIRRYLADKFYKDHLQTYKKRPIYWLFSSGKQGAFQALVYLHRYQEGTLARLRAEYVVPLTGKLQGRIAMLDKDRMAAPSAAARTRIGKQIDTLKKQHLELLAFDEKLRHYADMRITLDLDDGVKVNYGKFGDLLAEVKAVTGGVEE